MPYLLIILRLAAYYIATLSYYLVALLYRK
jgi:hypothetical protein